MTQFYHMRLPRRDTSAVATHEQVSSLLAFLSQVPTNLLDLRQFFRLSHDCSDILLNGNYERKQ